MWITLLSREPAWLLSLLLCGFFKIVITAAIIILSLKRFDLMRGFRARCACEDRKLCHCFLAERHLRAEERFKVYLSPALTQKGIA